MKYSRKLLSLALLLCITLPLMTSLSSAATIGAIVVKTDAAYSITDDFLAGNIPYGFDTSTKSIAAAQSQMFKNGTYYLNGEYSGDYLKYSASSVCAESGLLSSLGNSIKWNLKCVNASDNIYTITAYGNSTKYLGVVADSSNVEYVTVNSGSTVPARCKWKISIAANGGCLVKNTYSSQYLYSYGSAVYVSDALGTVGGAQYKSRVWRIPEISYLAGKELDSDFYFSTCYLFTGETKSPSINRSPSNAVWATPTDFTYTGTNTAYFSHNYVTGKFTTNSSAHYYTKITATHKVTNRSVSLSIAINPKAILMGISNSGHDHSSALTDIQSKITDRGYSSAHTYFGSYSIASVNNFLNTDCNNIFVSRSHGAVTTSSGRQIGTSILLNDSDSSIRYRSTESINNLELSNMKLVMFIACQTGAGGENGLNLPSVAVARGAATAIGFSESINCERANSWTREFFKLMKAGLSVRDACEQLDTREEFKNTTLTSHVICGNKFTTIGR